MHGISEQYVDGLERRIEELKQRVAELTKELEAAHIHLDNQGKQPVVCDECGHEHHSSRCPKCGFPGK